MKRLLSLVLCLILGLGCMTLASATTGPAAEADPNDPPPQRLSYISTATTSISVSGGQASCTGSIVGYYGTTTKVEITLYLERKTASGSTWTTYASDPKQTFNSFTGMYTMKKSVISGYQYRVRAVYTAWAGTKSETLTGYSSVMSY